MSNIVTPTYFWLDNEAIEESLLLGAYLTEEQVLLLDALSAHLEGKAISLSLEVLDSEDLPDGVEELAQHVPVPALNPDKVEIKAEIKE